MSNFIAYAREFLAQKYNTNSPSFKTSYSITKSFINKHKKLFESKSKTDEPYTNFKNNALEVLSIIQSSKLSKETKRKLLLFFALLLKNLEEKELYVKYFQLYSKLKYDLISERRKNMPRGYKEVQCLGVSLAELRKKPIDMNDFDPQTLLYNLLVFLDETPRLEYRFLIYNGSKTGSNGSKTGSNESKIGSNESKTDSNASKTGSNESKTGGNGSKTGSNKVKNGKSNAKNGKNNAKNKDEIGDNYLQKQSNSSNYVMILNNYKTYNTYGPWHIEIQNAKLCQYINKYIQNHKELRPGSYVFVNTVGKPFSSNKFSEYVQSTFLNKTDTKISINCLRLLKENQLFHHNPAILKMSLEDKDNWLIQHFRHSFATATLYYNRINKSESNPSVSSSNTSESSSNASISYPSESSSSTIFNTSEINDEFMESNPSNDSSSNFSNSSNDSSEASIHHMENKIISFKKDMRQLMSRYDISQNQVLKLISPQGLLI